MFSEYLPKFEFKNLYQLIFLKQNRTQIHKNSYCAVHSGVIELKRKEDRIILPHSLLNEMSHSRWHTHLCTYLLLRPGYCLKWLQLCSLKFMVANTPKG